MVWFYLLTMGVAAASCAVFGEMYYKMAADRSPELAGAIVNKFMAYRIALLTLENVLLFVAFRKGCPFILMSITQLVCYAVVSVGVGVRFFHEQVAWLKGIGIILALLGIFIIMVSDWAVAQPQTMRSIVGPSAS